MWYPTYADMHGVIILAIEIGSPECNQPNVDEKYIKI